MICNYKTLKECKENSWNHTGRGGYENVKAIPWKDSAPMYLYLFICMFVLSIYIVSSIRMSPGNMCGFFTSMRFCPHVFKVCWLGLSDSLFVFVSMYTYYLGCPIKKNAKSFTNSAWWTSNTFFRPKIAKNAKNFTISHFYFWLSL